MASLISRAGAAVFRIGFVLSLVSLVGCNKPMTNEGIIRETKVCEQSGMLAEPLFCGHQVCVIQCIPKSAR